MQTWFLENKKRISDVLFCAALTIELVLMLVEKSEILFSLESYVFRVTFLLTLLSVLLMERKKSEWAVVAVFAAFTFICYRISGKNDLLRVAVFLMAARDIDLKKAMKYCFYISVAGFIIIALLAVCGVMGDVVQVGDFGRGIPNERRYVFGFGHPNTLFGCIYVVLLMWIWIYGRKSGILSYIGMSAGSLAVAVVSRSRTGLAVIVLTLVAAILVRLFPKAREKKFIYVAEAVFSPVICMLTAVLAAGFSGYMFVGEGIPISDKFWEIERLISYRMSNVYYSTPDRGGILTRWKLFAGHGAEGYFDMGWVRLFYWYGIIPTVIIALLLFIIIRVCWEKRDIWTLVLIFSASLYTIVEATFVTRYIGRDFFLLIAGVYLGDFFRREMKDIRID